MLTVLLIPIRHLPKLQCVIKTLALRILLHGLLLWSGGGGRSSSSSSSSSRKKNKEKEEEEKKE